MVNKEYKWHYIYKTTNLINNKYYIGMHSTDDLNDGYFGSGKILRASIKKYGKKNFKFEILEYLPDRKSLKEREEKIVDQEQVDSKLCMNLQLGGGGGFINKAHEIKCHQGASASQKRKWQNPVYKIKMTSLLRTRLAKLRKEGKFDHIVPPSFKNKKHKEETKQKISLVNRGKRVKEKNSQYGTMWITNGIKNKKIKSDSIIPQDWYRGRIV